MRRRRRAIADEEEQGGSASLLSDLEIEALVKEAQTKRAAYERHLLEEERDKYGLPKLGRALSRMVC